MPDETVARQLSQDPTVSREDVEMFEHVLRSLDEGAEDADLGRGSHRAASPKPVTVATTIPAAVRPGACLPTTNPEQLGAALLAQGRLRSTRDPYRGEHRDHR